MTEDEALKAKMAKRALGFAEAELALMEKRSCPVCEKLLESHPIRQARSCFVHGDYTIGFKDGEYVVMWTDMRWGER